MGKIKKVIKIITFALFIIALKIWHLTIIQKSTMEKLAKNPQEKTILIPSSRGIIFSRDNIPLATNKISYQACIYYAHIRNLPTYVYKKIHNKKEKYYVRKNHIKNLSKMLAEELEMDAARIQDLIHSKASLIPHIPFVLKDNIDEKTYYRLKILEKDYTGLHVQIAQKRSYPFQKLACQTLGYLGVIDQKKYFTMAKKIKDLQKKIEKKPLGFLKDQLFYLKEQAYNINDLLGKSGMEQVFEDSLRGSHGKKTYQIDTKGNFLKELSSSFAKDGESIITSLSVPLQNMAEQLLVQEEDSERLFIKGSAIIAMDPNNGEILALASSPRFNPNDFIPKANPSKISKWLEFKNYVKDIYLGKIPFTKEIYHQKKIKEKKIFLTFSDFIELVAKKPCIKKSIQKIANIKNSIFLQEQINSLLYLSHTKNPVDVINHIFPKEENHIEINTKHYDFLKKEDVFAPRSKKEVLAIKKSILPFLHPIKNNHDKLLLIDLCRLFVDCNLFSDDLLKKTGHISLELYWNISKQYFKAEEKVRKFVYPIFQKKIFNEWRKENQKDFLLKKRKEEKENNTYNKPYIDLLDKKEKSFFEKFFQKIKLSLLTSILKKEFTKKNSYLQNFTHSMQHISFPSLENHLKSFDNTTTYFLLKTISSASLNKKLLGSYRKLQKNTLEDLALSFYPKNGYGYCTSFTHKESSPLGSIFKIVTSYAALKNKYEYLLQKRIFPKKLNPLTMIDTYRWDPKVKSSKGIVVGYHLNGTPFPRYYKKGRLIPSKNKNIGQIDITDALARSSNPYFSILAGDYLSAEDLLQSSKDLNIGKKTNINLPKEIKGNLPKDIAYNKTSLYSFAIGQHSLVTTPLQVAVMFSAIANKGHIYKPQILKGKKELMQTIQMPSCIRNTILEGLHKVLWSEKGTARANIIKKLQGDPVLLQKYKNLKYRFVGKTSTAEIMYKEDLSSDPAQKKNHVWFAGISFKDTAFENPELVVVVYLRFGTSGKEAAPIAAKIIQKYKKILSQKNH